MQPAVILIGTGNPSHVRRGVARMCDRAGIAGLDYWIPVDIGIPGYGVAIALPVSRADRALDIAGLLDDVRLFNRRTRVYVYASSILVGKGWNEGGYVYRPGGFGDKFTGHALVQRVERERKAPYLATAKLSEEDGSARKRYADFRDAPEGRARNLARIADADLQRRMSALIRDARGDIPIPRDTIQHRTYADAGGILDGILGGFRVFFALHKRQLC